METKPLKKHIVEKTNATGSFTISEMIIPKNELESILKESIKNALATKSTKIIEKNSSFLLNYLQKNTLPIEYFSSSFDIDDLMGIIGEIVSEIYHKQCLNEDPIYVKWKATGTSKSKGLDLIFHKNEKLYSIECKHPHESLANQNNDKSRIILRTINDGLNTHDDIRTKEFMVLLFRKYFEQKRLLTGSKLNTSAIDTRIQLIRSLLRKNDIIEEINLVADKIYEKDIDNNSLESNLNYSKFALISKSIGVVLLLIENIHELSMAISKNGN